MNAFSLLAPMSLTRLTALDLLRDGNALKDIAAELGITRQAIYRHMCIAKKFGLVSGPGPVLQRPKWHLEPLGEALLDAVTSLRRGAGGLDYERAVLTPFEARALLLLISKA